MAKMRIVRDTNRWKVETREIKAREVSCVGRTPGTSRSSFLNTVKHYAPLTRQGETECHTECVLDPAWREKQRMKLVCELDCYSGGVGKILEKVEQYHKGAKMSVRANSQCLVRAASDASGTNSVWDRKTVSTHCVQHSNTLHKRKYHRGFLSAAFLGLFDIH